MVLAMGRIGGSRGGGGGRSRRRRQRRGSEMGRREEEEAVAKKAAMRHAKAPVAAAPASALSSGGELQAEEPTVSSTRAFAAPNRLIEGMVIVMCCPFDATLQETFITEVGITIN
jgi:hypothetical protein